LLLEDFPGQARDFQLRVVQEAGVVLNVVLQEREHLRLEPLIAVAARLQQGPALRRRRAHDFKEHFLDAPGVHAPPSVAPPVLPARSSSRLSHARAKVHSFLTVAGESDKAAAVSSMESPAK